MSLVPEVLKLAAAWNIPEGHGDIHSARALTACRWQLAQREFDEQVVPANTLMMPVGPARSWRVRGARREPASPGGTALGLLPQGPSGRWIFGSSIDVYHFYLTDAALDEIVVREGGGRAVRLQDRLRFEDPVLLALLREIVVAFDGGAASRLYADTLSVAVALRLARDYADEPAPRALRHPATREALSRRTLVRVVEYLNAHLADDVSLAEIAAVAGLSPYHFCRAFRHHMGLPPHAWLTRLRIDRAQELMKQDRGRTLTAIALEVGYGSPSAFGAAFRRTVGQSPLAWRRDHARD